MDNFFEKSFFSRDTGLYYSVQTAHIEKTTNFLTTLTIEGAGEPVIAIWAEKAFASCLRLLESDVTAKKTGTVDEVEMTMRGIPDGDGEMVWIPEKDIQRVGQLLREAADWLERRRKLLEDATRSALSQEDIDWIQKNKTSGDWDGVPWVGVPNRPGREPYKLDEILIALRAQRE